MSPPVRLSLNRFWDHFSPDIQRLDLDFWFNSNQSELISKIEWELSNFSINSLKNDAKNFQLWSSNNELSDERLANSPLGQELGKINVVIIAVIVRPIPNVIQGNHIRCSLLLDHQN